MFTAADIILDCVGLLITVVVSKTSPERAETAGTNSIAQHTAGGLFSQREERRDGERIQSSEAHSNAPPSPQGVKARNIPIGTVNSNNCTTKRVFKDSGIKVNHNLRMLICV
jgi:hypothetical protein